MRRDRDRPELIEDFIRRREPAGGTVEVDHENLSMFLHGHRRHSSNKPAAARTVSV